MHEKCQEELFRVHLSLRHALVLTEKGYVKLCTTHRFTLPPHARETARETKGNGIFDWSHLRSSSETQVSRCASRSTPQLWLGQNESENQNWDRDIRTHASASPKHVGLTLGADGSSELVPNAEFWVLRAEWERVLVLERIGSRGRGERRAEKRHAGGSTRAANERGNGASRRSATGARSHRQQARVIADTGGHRSLRRRTQLALAQPLALELTQS